MKARPLDANVLLRFLLADHPEQSPRCLALITRVQNGQETVFLPEVVVCDVVWTLQSFYKLPPQRIRRFLEALLLLEGIQMGRKTVVHHALHLFSDLNIDFSDALIAAEMSQAGQAELYSYDRDFERVPGVTRVEP